MGRFGKLMIALVAAFGATFVAAGDASAESGLHCNLHVCFDVHGTGLNVTSADGYYANSTYHWYCGYMILFVNGTVRYSSSSVCTAPWGWGATPMHININRTYAGGTQICAEIRGTQGHSNLAGHPCITVHS
jgi:hypothetical protein